MVGTRLWGRNLCCAKALDTSFSMRLSDFVHFQLSVVGNTPFYKSLNRSETGFFVLITNHKCTKMHRQMREACHVSFQKVLGTDYNSRVHQIYHDRQDGVTIWPLLFGNRIQIVTGTLVVQKGGRRNIQIVVSCAFLRAMGCTQ